MTTAQFSRNSTPPFVPIGIVRSQHQHASETPIQPVYAKGCRGRVEIFSE